MADFEQAMFIRIQNEGWRANDPRDEGGETIIGISARYYPDAVKQMRNMSFEDALKVATGIYLRDFWNALRLTEISNQDIAQKIFDMAVTSGIKDSCLCAQRACNDLGCDLLLDGNMGMKTLASLNMYRFYDVLSKVITYEREKHYFAEADRKPEKRYALPSWIRRA